MDFDISSSSTAKVGRLVSCVPRLSSSITEGTISGDFEDTSGLAVGDSLLSWFKSVGRLLCDSTEKVVNSADLGEVKSVSFACNRSITIRSG